MFLRGLGYSSLLTYTAGAMYLIRSYYKSKPPGLRTFLHGLSEDTTVVYAFVAFIVNLKHFLIDEEVAVGVSAATVLVLGTHMALTLVGAHVNHNLLLRVALIVRGRIDLFDGFSDQVDAPS